MKYWKNNSLFPFLSVYAYKIDDIKKMTPQQYALLNTNHGIWIKDLPLPLLSSVLITDEYWILPIPKSHRPLRPITNCLLDARRFFEDLKKAGLYYHTHNLKFAVKSILCTLLFIYIFILTTCFMPAKAKCKRCERDFEIQGNAFLKDNDLKTANTTDSASEGRYPSCGYIATYDMKEILWEN